MSLRSLVAAASLLFLSSMALAEKTIAEYSQEELRSIVLQYPTCELTPSNEAAVASDKTVSVVGIETTQRDLAYFAVVEASGSDEPTIYYLEKTHLVMGGYKSQGDRSYFVGKSVSASFNFLSQISGGRGTDTSVTISDHVLSPEEKFYNYCEF